MTTVTVPGSLFSAVREMYCRAVYWPAPKFYPKPGDVVVDLGANVGLYAVHAACAGATVVAVEAQSGFAATLLELSTMNGVDGRIRSLHVIVGSERGLLADVDVRTRSKDWGDEPARMSIDDVLGIECLDHVDLMKIDIEGSEYALLSNTDWLTKVDRVVMEVHTGFGEPEFVVRVLTDAGFSCERATADLRWVHALNETGYIYASRT